MKKISISFYKGGQEIVGVTDGYTVFCTVDGKHKEMALNNFYVNWIEQ